MDPPNIINFEKYQPVPFPTLFTYDQSKFLAHSCATNNENPVQLKLINALSSVGFPAIQASLSTIICVLSLLFVPIYMSQVIYPSRNPTLGFHQNNDPMHFSMHRPQFSHTAIRA